MTLKQAAVLVGTAVWNFCAIQGVGSMLAAWDVRDSIIMTATASTIALIGAWWYMRRHPERIIH